MVFSFQILLYTLLFVVKLSYCQETSDIVFFGTVSGYGDQRLCVQECLGDYETSFEHQQDVRNAAGCANPVQKQCFCREDLKSLQSSFLTRCLSSSCDGFLTADVTSAWSMVNSYCSRSAPARNDVATTTLSDDGPTGTVLIMQTVTDTPSDSSGTTKSPTTGGTSLLLGVLLETLLFVVIRY